jgi:hypothetical protein
MECKERSQGQHRLPKEETSYNIHVPTAVFSIQAQPLSSHSLFTFDTVMLILGCAYPMEGQSCCDLGNGYRLLGARHCVKLSA